MKCLCGVSLVFISVLGWSGGSFANGGASAVASSTTTSSDPIANTCSEANQFTFTEIGVAMDATKLGVVVGTAIANSTAYVTPEGTVRMYFGAEGVVKSAVSSDGTTFRVEAGDRIHPAGHFKVIRLDDGRLRMFIAEGVEDILSHISSDGLTWTQESGIRISRTEAGMPDGMMGLTIVPTSGGGFRGYTSDLARTDRPPGGHFIKSATSTDLLTWTLESGVRIGTGASTLTESAEQPHALLRGSNCVTLFYFKADLQVPGMYYSTATDGLTFTSEFPLGIRGGNGPSIIQLTDGTYLLYHDAGHPTEGFSIHVGKLELSPAVSATSDPAPDIKANGSDGPLTLSTTGTLSVSVSLTAGSGAGTNADWWLLAKYSENWYYYNLSTNSWQAGQTVTYQGALGDLSTYTLPNMSGLPAGSYILYFGVDTLMNGLVSTDRIYYDKVDLTVQ